MGPKIWRSLIVVAGAAMLIATTGTAVIAMINDDDTSARVATNRQADDAGGLAAGICLEGAEDCLDTFNEDGLVQCATDEPCGDFDGTCAVDQPCDVPQPCPEEGCSAEHCAADVGCETFVPARVACAPGVTYEECFPDGTPAGYDCVEQESFPVQVVCYGVGCDPVDLPVSILPVEEPTILPGFTPQVDEPQTDPAVETQPVITIEPFPAPEVCNPGVDCASQDMIVEGCLGTDPCTRSSEQDARCLPPDCSISSDGAVACPEPQECKPIDGEGVTAPVPAICELVDPVPGSGSGSSEGSSGSSLSEERERAAEVTKVAGGAQ